MEQFDLPDPPAARSAHCAARGLGRSWDVRMESSKTHQGELSFPRGPAGTVLGRDTRTDPWKAAKVKKQQHGALRSLPAWHTSVTTCVDTEQCCHVMLYVAVAVNTSPRQRTAQGSYFLKNVLNKRARACLGDMAHH